MNLSVSLLDRRLEMENWSTPKVVLWLRENGFSHDTQVLFHSHRIQGFDLFNDLHDLFRPGTVTSILINKIIERRNMYIRKRESVRDSFLSAISETDTEGDNQITVSLVVLLIFHLRKDSASQQIRPLVTQCHRCLVAQLGVPTHTPESG